ncbi:selenide, water dikinase SelD [candidate division KSB1 bacterium]|nr:selenide, water dikinase SelD [candidate division KSB1 bacterium]
MREAPIYLDHNATTPIAPQVADAMVPYLHEHFGNPSSSHWYGIQAKKAVEKARGQLARLLGCEPDEIVFTSGGSESNNFAIIGVAQTYRNRGNHIITSAIEHPAVINVCRFLQQSGFEVTYLPVDKYGWLNPVDLKSAIKPDTLLISIMHANNEVGTIQPIQELADLAKEHNIIFHTDAAQSVGKIPCKVHELNVDLLSVAGHKLYAPKGIGALFMKRGIQLNPFIHGAGHETGRRAGTENVLEIVGLGSAAELAEREIDTRIEHSCQLRERLWQGLKSNLPELILNGHPDKRLPNTLNVSIPDIDANTLLSELDQIAASPGAACHSDVAEPSPVLMAMGISTDLALSTIRFSTGRLNDEAQIDRAIELISDTVKRLKPETTQGCPIAINESEIKLTHFTHGLGCACKLRPQNLEQVLKDLPILTNPDILVGTNTSDDAAIYRISDQQAIVQTVDFFTPIVDDPYHFGAIAAANSLSDIYAMGGKPLFALNIVAFPEKRLPLSILKSILKGASDKAAEAGISIIGGHTIEDAEPKFGLAVTGLIHPEKIISNATAKPGDMLILTKPIGLGILTTALKRGLIKKETAETAINIMSTLNRIPAEVMQQFPVTAATDVTGFGLMGHLKEMTTGSNVTAEIYYDAVPLISEAFLLANSGVIPGGTEANYEFVSQYVDWDNAIPHAGRYLLCDAQTSGGLIIAVPKSKAHLLVDELRREGVDDAAIIGQITGVGKGKIKVHAKKSN